MNWLIVDQATRILDEFAIKKFHSTFIVIITVVRTHCIIYEYANT